jgi:hypothetical protein
VEVSGGETAFAGEREFPFLRAGGRIDGVEVAVVAGEIDQAVGDRRRGSDAALGFEFPFFRAGVAVEGVEEVVAASDVERVSGDRRRG